MWTRIHIQTYVYLSITEYTSYINRMVTTNQKSIMDTHTKKEKGIQKLKKAIKSQRKRAKKKKRTKRKE